MYDNPQNKLTRSEWASMSWKQAQTAVAKMLQNAGYMIFEEKRLGKSKRTDILVINNQGTNVNLGIVEVKAYKKVSPKMVQKSIRQACIYLNSFGLETLYKQKWGNKHRNYFVAVVFTNDYPVNISIDSENTMIKSFSEVFSPENFPKLVISTPNSLLSKLRVMGLLESGQDILDHYFP